MATFTRDWNEASPLGSAEANTIDDIIRANEVDISDRLKALIYGFIAGENDGVPGCKNLAFKVQSSDPTVAASTIVLYSKDVSSESHLYVKDESGDVRQITKAAGLLNIIAGDYAANSIDQDDIELANNAALTAKDAAGTGTVNLILAGTNDLPTLPDSAEMASNAAPVEDEAIANKKYVDDQDESTSLMHDTEGGYNNVDVDGTKTKVYTKYFTGTLDADSSTSVAHGITGVDKILSVSVSCYDDSQAMYRSQELYYDAAATSGFIVDYDATNVRIAQVGTNVQGNKYRIRIDYIL